MFCKVNVGFYKFVDILLNIFECDNNGAYYTLIIVKQPKKHFLSTPFSSRVKGVLSLQVNDNQKGKDNPLTMQLTWIICIKLTKYDSRDYNHGHESFIKYYYANKLIDAVQGMNNFKFWAHNLDQLR